MCTLTLLPYFVFEHLGQMTLIPVSSVKDAMMSRGSRRGRRIGEKRDERERKGRWVGDVHIPTCDWFSFSENP